MSEIAASKNEAFVTFSKLVELMEISEDINPSEIAAFVKTPLISGWLEVFARKVDNVEIYPATLADFLGRAFYLFQLGADIRLLDLIINRPYLVIGMISGMVDALVTMEEEGNEEKEEANVPTS